ncbi:uncharacterized protein LTR77_011205 [Saxophila tyrrhenica]|uniref:Uncharacterized protein n=1 Tax=Saxophila tyrrhenica TaxID=1690608 RepID=A0AAV9NT88_9PEZI|nr:hypothetical protein LTR77_011205 [Saxophila tyrrhenica]
MLRPFAQRHLLPRASSLARQTRTPTRHLQSSSRCLTEDKSDPAFSPQETRPEEQNERAAEATKKDTGINATDNVTPANQKTNRPRDPMEGGSQGSQPEEGGGGIQRSGQSGGGSPKKSGGGKSG